MCMYTSVRVDLPDHHGGVLVLGVGDTLEEAAQPRRQGAWRGGCLDSFQCT